MRGSKAGFEHLHARSPRGVGQGILSLRLWWRCVYEPARKSGFSISCSSVGLGTFSLSSERREGRRGWMSFSRPLGLGLVYLFHINLFLIWCQVLSSWSPLSLHLSSPGDRYLSSSGSWKPLSRDKSLLWDLQARKPAKQSRFTKNLFCLYYQQSQKQHLL